MALRKRRIEGKTLKKLLEALGQDYYSYLRREEGWTVNELIGRASVRPVDKGFEVELAVKAKEVNVKKSLTGNEERLYKTHCYDVLKGIIPYSPKLETETQEPN